MFAYPAKAIIHIELLSVLNIIFIIIIYYNKYSSVNMIVRDTCEQISQLLIAIIYRGLELLLDYTIVLSATLLINL